jgi:uncharacterized membrane protein
MAGRLILGAGLWLAARQMTRHPVPPLVLAVIGVVVHEALDVPVAELIASFSA